MESAEYKRGYDDCFNNKNAELFASREYLQGYADCYSVTESLAAGVAS